jgi:hypothetical protein
VHPSKLRWGGASRTSGTLRVAQSAISALLRFFPHSVPSRPAVPRRGIPRSPGINQPGQGACGAGRRPLGSCYTNQITADLLVEIGIIRRLKAFLVSRRSCLTCTLVVITIIASTGCEAVFPQTLSTPTFILTSAPTSSAILRPNFTIVQQADIFTVYAVEGDEQAVQDVAKALQEQAIQINRVLDYEYRDPITIEIFPDQDSLDHYGMNPEMRGYYAYSGDQRIQMVSPRNPAAQQGIEYSQRVSIAVHEYVHLVSNAINPNMPPWLNEGIAIYIGPHDIYTYVCQNVFPFEQIPSFREIQEAYDSVSAADLFAYALVDFIAHEYGREKLNLLLRNPDKFEDILGDTPTEFERRWRDYMNLHYSQR